ncbi:MAG: alpha/beta fold hydrolase [Acidobacteriota bacterium]
MWKIALLVVALPYLWCYIYTGGTLAYHYYYCRKKHPDGNPPAARLLAVFLVESNHFALFMAMRLFRPLRRRVRAFNRSEAGSPVVFCHGYTMDASGFCFLRRRLRLSRPVYGITLPKVFAPIDELSKYLAEDLTRIMAAHPAGRIALVAHSMGGLVARSALRDPALAARVGVLVTLGSPHNGTPLARIAPGRNARDMVPGSPFLNRLNEASLPCRVVSLYTRADNLVFPYTASILEGARNIEMPLMGHMGLLLDGTVAGHVKSEV